MDRSGLNGGIAVITGAANGIGRGIAKAAASRGMDLVLVDVAQDALGALTRELEDGGTTVSSHVFDVRDSAAIEALAATTFERFGAIRWLVNNAGVESVGYLWELAPENLKRTVDINIMAPLLFIRAFVPRMIASAAPAFVTNLSSAGGVAMLPMQGPYTLSKHAVLSMTECLQLELERAAPFIQASVVMPGAVRTGIFEVVEAAEAPAAEKLNTAMHSMLSEHGLDAEEAGRMIADQVEAGNFWIATHPELLDEAAQERADYLSRTRRPTISPRLISLFE